MRLIDADKLYPDCLTKDGALAISQSQIANAPTVEARPQGEWIESKEEVYYDYWTVCECSLCKHSWALGELSIEDVKNDYKFCPNCGAKMTKEAENDLSI